MLFERESKYKKILLAISVLALLIGVSFFISTRQTNNSNNELTITPEGIVPAGADAGSFKQLGMIFAKDKDHVYYDGEIAPDYDAESFEVLEDAQWIKDKNGVYRSFPYSDGWTGIPYEKLEGADPKTFELLGNGYAKDKDTVFVSNTIAEGADPATFEIIPGDSNNSFSWSRDKNHVFHSGRIVEGASPSTFRVLNYMLGIDGSRVYSTIYPIKDADAATFEMIEEQWPSYARDKNRVYAASYNAENPVIVGADPTTFQVIDEPYSRDKNHVFVYTRMLAEADVATFKMIDGYYAKDKNHVYNWEGDVVEGADPATYVPE